MHLVSGHVGRYVKLQRTSGKNFLNIDSIQAFSLKHVVGNIRYQECDATTCKPAKLCPQTDLWIRRQDRMDGEISYTTMRPSLRTMGHRMAT